MMPEHRRRLRALAVAVLVLCVSGGGLAWHAQERRRADNEARTTQRALVHAMGFADLALSSSTRWIRHPSQVEPHAAVQDAPGALDTDPAGAWIGPVSDAVAPGASP